MLTLLAPAPLNVRAEIDRYLDTRHRQTTASTSTLARKFAAARVKISDIEAAIRKGPAVLKAPLFATPGKIVGGQKLEAEHVDYATSYFLYIPKSYSEAKLTGLIVVGHGGNGAMSKAYAESTARSYISYWTAEAERKGYIVAAPVTERGWGFIGDSIVFSLISSLSRQFNLDPDRVYLTGHSMGGHLTWRSAFAFPDRWAAVSPMSGGYDYVAQGFMPLLSNVPGYATHGSTEPYEIADFNRKMKGWLDERRYDWIIDERPGGHEIFRDRLPIIADFFASRKRNLYRSAVYAQHQGLYALDRADAKREGWDRGHTWTKGRPIDRTTFFWLRLKPETEKESAEKVRKAYGQIKSRNLIEVTAENVGAITVYLHPKMVEFGKPLTIRVNGRATKVTPRGQIPVMLEEIRRTDDRGRIFWDAVDVQVVGSQPVPVPSRSPGP